jgi:parallel beta-helix repeat protein
MKHRILLLAFALDLGLILTLLWLFNGGPSLIRADSPHHVALDCTGVPAPCDTSLQDAVDAAIPGDVILVASGVYSDMHSFPVPSGYLNPPASGLIAQVVYISKTLTIRGGYTPAFTDPPDPEANPTTLDARGQGRAIVIAGTVSPTLEGLRITGGDSTGLGGGLWDVTGGGGGVYVINATATISNNVVSGNSAGDGGGLFLQSSPTTLYKNTVISNTAEYGGGGVYVRESAATLSENTINANTAAGVYGSGGGVYVRQSAATLSGNTIDANTAQSNGGGIYLDNSFNAMLDWNTVISNTAISGHGGGMDVRQSDGATLNGNTVVANTAQNKGGGLHVYQSYATLIGNTVISNTADSGGGLHLVGRAVTMTANTILSNTALMGGGLYLEYKDATLNENTISFNRATIDYGEGGGIFIYDSDPALNANIITFNYADWGDGLGLYRSSPMLINTVVTDNSAGEHGSGLHIRLHSSPRLLHTTIARNLGGDGSGVYVTHGGESYCSVAMTNTILVS